MNSLIQKLIVAAFQTLMLIETGSYRKWNNLMEFLKDFLDYLLSFIEIKYL